MPNLESMYQRLAVEVEHLRSSVTKCEDQTKTGNAVDAFDFGRITVRWWTRIETGNNLRCCIIRLLQRQYVYIAGLAHEHEMSFALAIDI
jgi:hypothetical protein